MTQQEATSPYPLRSAAAGGPDAVSWRVAGPVLLAGLLALLLFYADTAVSFYDLWESNSAYNHAFLVVPVFLYLIWERRHFLAALDPVPNPFGLVIIAGFGAIWLVADAVDVTVGRQFALMGMVEGLIFTLLGWRVFRALLFPLAYLWLVLPTDFGLLTPLQNMATVASAWLIGLLGIPIYVEGVFIEIPTGRFWVTEGCAGLNFLLAGLALSVLYVEQIYNDWRKRVAGVLIMLAVAVMANWLRIFGLIVASHYLQNIYSIEDHNLEGWLLFSVIVFIMMWIGMRFRDPARDTRPPAAARPDRVKHRSLGYFVAIAVASAVAVGFYPAYAAYRQGDGTQAAQSSIAFPATVGAWRMDPEAADWRPKFERPHAQGTQRYGDGRRKLDVYVAYYANQSDGRELVSYDNRVFDEDTWVRLGSGKAAARIGGRDVEMTRVWLRAARVQRIVWQVYWVDGRYTRSPMIAKLLQAKADLLSGDRRSGFLAVSVEEGVDTAAMADFLAALPPFPDLIAPSPAGK